MLSALDKQTPISTEHLSKQMLHTPFLLNDYDPWHDIFLVFRLEYRGILQAGSFTQLNAFPLLILCLPFSLGKPVMIITEYMENGSLDSFLRVSLVSY